MPNTEGLPAADVSRHARARAFLARCGLVDAHNDLPSRILELWDGDVEQAGLARLQPQLHTDLARIRAGGLSGQFMAAYVPIGLSAEAAQERAIRLLEIIHALPAVYAQFAVTGSVAEIQAARRRGQVSIIPAIENADALAGEVDAVDLYRRLGVRYITLTHNATNEWADAGLGERLHGGLSEGGVRLIERMNAAGILVDCSHVSAEAVMQATEVSRAPVILSHSNTRALANTPRNAGDEELRAVARTGGVVGVNFYPPLLVPAESSDIATIRTVADHIGYLRDLIGVEHITLGSDFDGIDSVPEGLEDVGSFPALFVELADRGYSRSDLEKIAVGNILRVLRRAEEAQG